MSTLRTNALEGVDAKNSITIVAGAGNITTTNVQEGLCKCWADYDLKGTAGIDDSFNVGSLTDNGTGDGTLTFSSNMSSGNFAVGTCYNNETANKADLKLYNGTTDGRSTTILRLRKFEDGSAVDADANTAITHGDLA